MYKDILAGVGTLVVVFAVVSALLYLAETPQSEYRYLACVDPFTKQTFETDNTVTRIEVWPEAYAVHRSNGTLTLLPRTENLMCSLSTEVPNATSTAP